jgi:hypothetical protein
MNDKDYFSFFLEIEVNKCRLIVNSEFMWPYQGIGKVKQVDFMISLAHADKVHVPRLRRHVEQRVPQAIP